jgi:hypothetical protein
MAYVDVFNMHNYGMLRDPESFIPEMDTLLSYMDRYGGRKPIWITEYSYYAADDKPWSPFVAPLYHNSANLMLEDEKQAADWSVRYNVIKFARGVRKIFYHQAVDGQLNLSSGTLELAMMGEVGQPRKLYPAQAFQAQLFNADFRFEAQLADHGNPFLQAYAFQCGKKAVVVAWVTEKERESWKLHHPRGVKAYDIMGKPLAESSNAALGISPVYLVSETLTAKQMAAACRFQID